MATFDELNKYFDEYEANPQPQQLGANFNAPEQGGMPPQEETPYQRMMRERYGTPEMQAQQAQDADREGILNNILNGFTSGAAGVFGGIAGIPGQNAVSNYFDEVTERNAPIRQHDKAFESLSNFGDFLTDPSGAVYTVANQLGSMAALAPAAALVPEGVVGAGAAKAAHVLGKTFGRPAVNWLMTQGGRNALRMGVRGAATAVPESLSEWGSASAELDRQGDPNHMANSFEVFAKNMAMLPVSNGLEYMLLGKSIFHPKGEVGESLLKRIAMSPLRATPEATASAVQNGIEELYQQTASDQATGKEVGSMFDPESWTPSQRDAFEKGAFGSFILGMGSNTAGNLRGVNQEQADAAAPNNPAEPPADQPARQFTVEPRIANQVTNDQFSDAVNVAMNDTSANPVDRMRNLQGHITYGAKDGTNCARTIGLALVGTDYQDLIKVSDTDPSHEDNFVAVAQKNGQLKDPATYVPKPGDLAVVNDGNHIVMVSDNGGTIQNGSSANGVYESELSPQQMFGNVKYYISTSELSGGSAAGGMAQGQGLAQQQAEESQEDPVAKARQETIDNVDEVLGKKSQRQAEEEQRLAEAEQRAAEEREAAAQYRAQNASEFAPINSYQDAFSPEELAGLNDRQRSYIANNFAAFAEKNKSRTIAESRGYLRELYNRAIAKQQQANAGMQTGQNQMNQFGSAEETQVNGMPVAPSAPAAGTAANPAATVSNTAANPAATAPAANTNQTANGRRVFTEAEQNEYKQRLAEINQGREDLVASFQKNGPFVGATSAGPVKINSIAEIDKLIQDQKRQAAEEIFAKRNQTQQGAPAVGSPAGSNATAANGASATVAAPAANPATAPGGQTKLKAASEAFSEDEWNGMNEFVRKKVRDYVSHGNQTKKNGKLHNANYYNASREEQIQMVRAARDKAVADFNNLVDMARRANSGDAEAATNFNKVNQKVQNQVLKHLNSESEGAQNATQGQESAVVQKPAAEVGRDQNVNAQFKESGQQESQNGKGAENQNQAEVKNNTVPNIVKQFKEVIAKAKDAQEAAIKAAEANRLLDSAAKANQATKEDVAAAKDAIGKQLAEKTAESKGDQAKAKEQQTQQSQKPQPLTGKIREVMMDRLERALGKGNVQILGKDAFHDKLEDAYRKSGMTAEQARGKVETFRNGENEVYGFAQDGVIYLNEDLMNANTPAHEFTHVWAKVAQKVAGGRMWKEGVELLKQTDMWQEVANDPLYQNLENDDAIASEVLARLVGAKNEEYVNKLSQGKDSGLMQRIKRWIEKMFNAVRNILADDTSKPLTYEEFVNMPLKSFWDPLAGGQFNLYVQALSGQQNSGPAEAMATKKQEARPVDLSKPLPDKWSTSSPSAVGTAGQAEVEYLLANLDAAKKDPEYFAKIVAALKDIPGLYTSEEDPEKASEIIIDRITDNVKALFYMVDPEIRERAKKWYDGGHAVVKEWSNRYGISEDAAAGVIAVLSPQKDWFTNMSLAERILDCVFGHADKTWTKEMSAWADGHTGKVDKSIRVYETEDEKKARAARNRQHKKRGEPNEPAPVRYKTIQKDKYFESIVSGKENQAALKRARNKTLRQLLNEGDIAAAAIWIKCYDKAHNPRAYRVITPEGGAGGFATNKDGSYKEAAWGDFGSIEKAISIATNPTFENISIQLGGEHKVRNFANNLLHPESGDFATIDTHAVGVGIFQPASTSSIAVLDNFGGAGKNSILGLSGTYPLYYEAYRRAAEAIKRETGMEILPREVQSVTWEAVRNLFPAYMKTGLEEQAEIAGLFEETEKRIARGERPEDVLSEQSKYAKILEKAKEDVVGGKSAEDVLAALKNGIKKQPRITKLIEKAQEKLAKNKQEIEDAKKEGKKGPDPISEKKLVSDILSRWNKQETFIKELIEADDKIKAGADEDQVLKDVEFEGKEQVRIIKLFQNADKAIKEKHLSEEEAKKVLAEARKKAYNIGTEGTKKLREFSWESTPPSAVIGDTYDRSNVQLTKYNEGANAKTDGQNVGIKFDLGKFFGNNEELSGFLGKVKGKKKENLYKAINSALSNLVERVSAEHGTVGQVAPALQGENGSTGLGFNINIATPNATVSFAKMMGRITKQDAVVAISSKPVQGAQSGKTLSVQLPNGWGAKEIAEFSKTLEGLKDDKGNSLVKVHSAADGKMTIVNTSLFSAKKLQEKIQEVAPGFDVSTDGAYSAFLTKDDYGDEVNRKDGSGSDTKDKTKTPNRRADYIGAQFTEELKGAVRSAGGPELSAAVGSLGRGKGPDSNGAAVSGNGQILGEAQERTGVRGADAGRVELSAKAQVNFEVAPDPHNEKLMRRWGKLTTEEKQEASRKVSKEMVPKILRHLKVSDPDTAIKTQIGGYMEDTNPSLCINVEPNKALEVSNALGYAFGQDSMMFISPEETEGSFRTGAIHIKVDPNIGLEETDKLYKKLCTIKDGNGAPYVTGHTTVDGEMLILNNDSRIAAETLAEMINDLIPDYEIMTSEVFAGFPEKEGYGYADSEQGAVDGKTYDEGLNLLREETSRELERELDRAEGRRVSKNDSGLVQGERSGNQEAEVARGRGLLGKTESGTGLRGAGEGVTTEQTNESTQGDEGASSMPELQASFAGETKTELSRQKESVRKQYEGTDQWLKAPDGEDTKLTEDQWLTVRTPQFKEWFGDWENDPENLSVVTDANGEPRVMYHETDNSFDTFDIRHKGAGTNDRQTPYGVFLKPTPDKIGLGKKQMPLFASVKNPKYFEDREELDEWLIENVPQYKERLEERDKTWKDRHKLYSKLQKANDQEYNNIYKQWEDGKITEEEFDKKLDDLLNNNPADAVFKEMLEADDKANNDLKNLVDEYMRKAGYDGVVLTHDWGTGGEVNTTIAFNPNQVKDATGNNVSITSESDNIYASVAESTDPEIQRSVDEVADEIKKAFPSAKTVARDGQYLIFTMPNGSKIAVDIANQIAIPEKEVARARKAHGKNDSQPIRVNGYTRTFGKDAAITLSRIGDKGTAFHEAFHTAWNLVLNPKEKAAMRKYFKDKTKGKSIDEAMADAYRDWQLARQRHQGSMFGKLFQKIQDFAKKMQAILTGTENVHNVMRKVAEGEVWNREARNNKAKTDYLVTNESITGNTKVPVIDISDMVRTNSTDAKARAALAGTLYGKEFKILGSDAIGFVAKHDSTFRDGKEVRHKPGDHLIRGEGEDMHRDYLTNEVRQKALTAVEELLNNAIYIDKHNDYAHKSNSRWIDLYAAVRNGDNIYPIHIQAKEKDPGSDIFTVGKAMFYNLTNKEALPSKANHKLLARNKGKASVISVANLLQNVKDGKGRPYVTNGELNYDPGMTLETQIHIKDGTYVKDGPGHKAGDTINFVDEILEGRKKNETRENKYLPRGWVGLSRDGHTVVGRVLLGDPKPLVKKSKEYNESKIEDTNYDIDKKDKYYYPVLDVQDFRDNPRPIRRGGVSGKYRLEKTDKAVSAGPELQARSNGAQYSISSAIDTGFKKAEQYVNRNVRTANTNTAEGRTSQIYANTGTKTKSQSIIGYLKEFKDKFYREWVDKNHALHYVDDFIEKTGGKKLSMGEKIYYRAQVMRALANGAATTLIEGNEHSMNALRERIGKDVDPKNKAAVARAKELRAKFKNVTMRDVLETIPNKTMDSKYPDYLKKHGINSWREAFSNYIGARRLLELLRLVEDKSLQHITHSQKEFTDFIDKHPQYAKFRPKAFSGKWREQVQAMARKEPALAAQMAKELAKEYKLPKGISRADLEATVNNAPKEFNDAAQKFYQLQENLLILMEDGHLISQAVHDKINSMYKEYCPLVIDYSDTAPLDAQLEGFISRDGTGITNVGSMLKHVLALGSEHGLKSPLESTYNSIQMLTNRAERNKVGVHFVRMVENNPALAKSGLLERLPKKSADAKNCEFAVMENGEKVVYKTKPDMYGPIVGYDEDSAGIAFNVAANTANVLRAGATMSPSFIFRNLIRDTIFAAVSSRNGFVPLIDSYKGMMAYLHNKELRGEFDAMGVTSYNFFGSTDNMVKSMDELMHEAKIDGPISFLKWLASNFQEASEIVEASTRMGEYMKARKNGKSMEQAALDARDVTLDFSRSGVTGQKYNRLVPFFNAAIQGGDKMIRLVADEDTRAQTLRMLAQYIILPSLFLWAFNHDEPWYEELDPEIKNKYWILPGGKIRIPKPQEAGVVFGSGAEAIMDQLAKKDPVAMKNWAKAFRDVALPNMIPTIGLPLLEWWTNYSLFREKPIEGNRLKRLPVEQRYNSGTSELSKFIGDKAGLSPVKLDNTARGYLGTMGMFAWQLPDSLFESKQNLPSKKFTERTFVRDLFINDMNMNRTQEDFYDLVEKAQQQHAGYGKKGKPTAEVKAISKAMRDVSKVNKDIQEIMNSKTMDRDQKRQLIDNKRKVLHTIQKATINRYGSKFE